MAPRKRPRCYGSLVGILAKHLDNAMRLIASWMKRRTQPFQILLIALKGSQ